jgi:hypothetical protein
MDVTLDNVLITAPAAPATNGTAIEYSILHTASDMGTPGEMKRAAFVRPNFRADFAPVYDTKILYDYSLAEFSPTLSANPSSASAWDTAVWNTSTWGSGASTAFSKATGANGIGRTLAVAIRGNATAATVLISTDIMWNNGGVL